MRQSNQAQHDQPQTARPTHRSAQPTTRATSKGAFDENTTGVLMVASSQGWDDRGPAGGGESNKGGKPCARTCSERPTSHATTGQTPSRKRSARACFVLLVCFACLFLSVVLQQNGSASSRWESAQSRVPNRAPYCPVESPAALRAAADSVESPAALGSS